MILPTTSVKLQFANLEASQYMTRFPIVANNDIKYVCQSITDKLLLFFREMFHARKYHLEFPSPMIVHKTQHIYVNDFIKFTHDTLGTSSGKVLKYYGKVISVSETLIYNHAILLGG